MDGCGVMSAQMFFLAALATAAIAAPPVPRHKRRRHTVTATATRVLRSNAIALLALRHEMLRDFLVETHTEAAAFTDARVIDAGPDLRIGPTTVDVDFLGAPIVRARVHNRSSTSVDALLSVSVRDRFGRTEHASAWVEALGPSQTRTIELYCPMQMAPASVDWSVTPL